MFFNSYKQTNQILKSIYNLCYEKKKFLPVMLFIRNKASIKNECFLIFSYEVKHKLNIKINIHVVKKRFLLRTTLCDCASENREFVNLN
jgi:hypothetical protein